MDLPHHLAQLNTFCKSHPVQPKILFVPSAQVGYNVTTALALNGCEWANLHAVTPAEHAEELIGPALQAAGWSRLVQGVDLLMIEEALDHLGLARARALAPAFARTLHALRLGGVAAQELRGSGIDADKASGIALVYEAYQSGLAAMKLCDEAHLFRSAAQLLEREQAECRSRGTVFAIADGTALPELAHRYVQAVSRGDLVRLGRTGYGVRSPQSCAAARLPMLPFAGGTGTAMAVTAPPARQESAAGRAMAASSSDYVQGDLFAVTEHPVAREEPAAGADAESLADTVHPACALFRATSAEPPEYTYLREALGSETEVRGVLRDVLSRRLPLDSVEIAYTSARPYLTLLIDLVQRFDVAARFAAGIPVLLTGPGQALAAFSRWIVSGLAPGELIHALRTGHLRVGGGDGTDAWQVAAAWARVRAAGGRAGGAAAVQRLRHGHGSGVDGSEGEAARAAAVIERLLALVPEEGGSGLRQVTRASIDFLEAFAPVRGEIDRLAHESLVDRLFEIGASRSDEKTRPLADLMEWLHGLITEHACGASVAHAGSLYITPLPRAGYSARPHLFVVGMDESSFPGGVVEDAVLLDEERERVSRALPLQRHHPAEQTWQLARAIGMCPGTVTLVANRQSLSDGREPYPSPLFQQAQQQLGAAAVGRWRPVPESGEAALDETELALARYRGSGYGRRVREQFPWMSAGERALRARGHKGLTRFDGWLGPALRPELAIGTDSEAMSAARLETLAKCPMQYFLRYVLNARPPEEAADDPARWLQPLEMGELLHELYRDFMHQLCERGERADDENPEHERLLERLLRRQIGLFEERVPVVYRAAYQADVIRLQRCARVFLNAESAYQRQFTMTGPTAFEVEFGFEGANPVPLELSDRVRFCLRGRIDRVDTVRRQGSGGEEYVIWDYKTGSTYRYDGPDMLRGGENLQWVLYAYALEALTDGKVRSSGYFFAGDRGWGRRIEAPPPERSLVAALLEPLFEMVAQGAFVAVQKEDDHCRFCDFGRLCSAERKTKRDMTDRRDETSQLRAIAGERERLRASGAGGPSGDTIRAYLAAAGVEGLDDILAAEAEASLVRWLSGLQPELDWSAPRHRDQR